MSSSLRVPVLLVVLSAAGCAGLQNLEPPVPSAEQAERDAAESLRSAFERQDRLGLLSAVADDYRPSRAALEQGLIDLSLRVRDIRLQFVYGRRSHGPEGLGLEVRWSRSWVATASNAAERKEGAAVLVLRESPEGPRLARVDGANPFSP